MTTMLKAYYVTKSKNLYVIRCVDYNGNDVEIESGADGGKMFDRARELALSTGCKVESGVKLPPHLIKHAVGETCGGAYVVHPEPEPWVTVQQRTISGHG